MFNRKLNLRKLNVILFCIFLISACTEKNYNSRPITDKPLNVSAVNKKEKISEYIIVLNKGIKLTTALSSLKRYDTHLVKDLKRGRYLISLKNDPGINKLKKDIVYSKYIKHIQPNFIYTTQ